jgi:YtoQ family protein
MYLLAEILNQENRIMLWTVYLAGEIHSDWRNEIIDGAKRIELPIEFTGPVTDHDASDNMGTRIFGDEEKKFWKDQKGARLNAARTKTLIENADLVVVKFGEEYRQWNTAFDAGYASALGKPLIVMHPEGLTHALKEVDAAANAVAENTDQVVRALKYITTHH